MPEICRSILESGLDVRWYLIGYGGDEKLIRDKIAVAKMEEYVKSDHVIHTERGNEINAWSEKLLAGKEIK